MDIEEFMRNVEVDWTDVSRNPPVIYKDVFVRSKSPKSGFKSFCLVAQIWQLIAIPYI